MATRRDFARSYFIKFKEKALFNKFKEKALTDYLKEKKMATWHKIKIDQNSIEVQTAKAFLLKMPSKSAYKDYTFWIPSKLVRFARNGWNGTASFTDEFSFKVQKHGQGQYNKQEIINEKELSGSDMYKIWLDLDLAETE